MGGGRQVSTRNPFLLQPVQNGAEGGLVVRQIKAHRRSVSQTQRAGLADALRLNPQTLGQPAVKDRRLDRRRSRVDDKHQRLGHASDLLRAHVIPADSSD